MDYFGTLYPSEAFKAGQQQPTPVGETCLWCEEKIEAGDRGTWIQSTGGSQPEHLECFMRSILGSVAHQWKRCSCYGGEGEDDPEKSRRRNAQEAFELHLRRTDFDYLNRYLEEEVWSHSNPEAHCPFIHRDKTGCFCGKGWCDGLPVEEQRREAAGLAEIQLWCLESNHVNCIIFKGDRSFYGRPEETRP